MKKIIYVWIVCCSIWGCNGFVDVVPKGNTIPETVDDLAKMLNMGSFAVDDGNLYFETAFSLTDGIEILSDDYTVSETEESRYYLIHKNSTFIQNMLKWSPFIYSIAENDRNWDGLFRGIYICNYVLSYIDQATEGNTYKRSEIKGQALVHRAMNYFLLVNLYGKQYEKGGTNDALAIPLILEPDINKQYPRATVAQIYRQLTEDLNEAVTLLEVPVPEFSNNPGKAAAFALRARVNLWIGDYDAAYKDATDALALQNELIDYNTCSPFQMELAPGVSVVIPTMVIGYPQLSHLNKEVVYARYNAESMRMSFSQKMLDIIDTENDLRYTLFYVPFPLSGFTDRASWARFNHSGIYTSEVWLTQAEAALRKAVPDMGTAVKALNAVRDCRYKDKNYAVAPTTSDALLEEIWKERRREISFTEMSFLDKKRRHERMERTVYGQHYTLSADSPLFQLPIPLNVMAFNPTWIQNER